ncbi:MAG TPA: hypothetical protein VMY35_11440 [Phycisphaerae bacterium]|nr:hypothetical protein [Phycisphaerae bacterium]
MMRILIRTTTARSTRPVTVRPARIRIPHRPLRVLDFDCEARPLHWISGDYVSKEITAIAWAWCDRPDHVWCYLLGQTTPQAMLEEFRRAYNEADLVTGHYIRGYDLPVINGSLTEYGLAPLGDKLTCDTKNDFIRRQGLSNSQENIGAMLGLSHKKVRMNQQSWRDANRLTPTGIAETRARVVGDVRQHIEMRRRLIELGYLGPAVLWKSGAHATPEPYTP